MPDFVRFCQILSDLSDFVRFCQILSDLSDDISFYFNLTLLVHILLSDILYIFHMNSLGLIHTVMEKVVIRSSTITGIHRTKVSSCEEIVLSVVKDDSIPGIDPYCMKVVFCRMYLLTS